MRPESKRRSGICRMKRKCCRWGQCCRICGQADLGRTTELVQPLMREQPLLALQAAAVAGQRAVRTDDPMARNQDGNGIAAVREPHRPRCIRIADALRQLTVAPGCPVRNFSERTPYALLELGSLQVQRQIEVAAGSREVFLELPRRLRQRPGIRVFLPVVHSRGWTAR